MEAASLLRRVPRRVAGGRGIAALLTLAIAGCASLRDSAPEPAFAAACAEAWWDLEARAAAAGIDPARPHGIDAFPGLATTRSLSAFDPSAGDEAERTAWLARLVDAGERRRGQLAGALVARGLSAGASFDRACVSAAVAAYRAQDPELERLATAARIRDDYRTGLRALGLYPLTSLPVRAGVARLQEETQARFAGEPGAASPDGERRRYAPPLPTPAARVAPGRATDVLGVRLSALSEEALEALFAVYAPALDVEHRGDFDRPGVPFLAAADQAAVATQRPVAYHYATVMPFAGRLRLQLNYVFWFPGRPRTGPFDTLGGALDGLVWRVTLDDEGDVLLYDSIHPCGCYHLFFPSPDLAVRREAADLPEPPLVVPVVPAREDAGVVVLRLASATHYLEAVRVEERARAAADAVYDFEPYERLYAVDAPGGPASLFARHGLVPGTQRGERFYLWPMGVRSPGAMRERGRQATAFLGRRHFDDAGLLDALFVPTRGS